ncbi:MAG TPA: hypothetical protein VKY74_21140, partial [Chloroflexia bacterium]|nr:hypothetical protein [Chloroflexia bacterium]
MSTASSSAVRLRKGFGAGAGAALVMIILMALERLALGIPSIPELLQGAFLRLVPGDLFEFMIHLLGPGAKVLLLVQILEGMLLAGGLLGWLFVRQWRPAAPEASAFRRLLAAQNWAGVFYGLLIGVGLVVLFLLLYVLEIMNPQPNASRLLPVSLSLLSYGLAFGLTLVSLLPWPASDPAVNVVPEGALDTDRRGFMRMAGGTVLALVAGAGLWGVLTKVLAEPGQAGLVAEGGTPGPVSGADATQTALTNADIGTAIAQSGGDITDTPAP